MGLAGQRGRRAAGKRARLCLCRPLRLDLRHSGASDTHAPLPQRGNVVGRAAGRAGQTGARGQAPDRDGARERPHARRLLVRQVFRDHAAGAHCWRPLQQPGRALVLSGTPPRGARKSHRRVARVVTLHHPCSLQVSLVLVAKSLGATPTKAQVDLRRSGSFLRRTLGVLRSSGVGSVSTVEPEAEPSEAEPSEAEPSAQHHV